MIFLGFLFAYLAPLMFVLFITMCKEAFDDFQRYRRDKDMNLKKHEVLTSNGFKMMYSQDLKVGQIIKVH
jgi:phospholipid-translocating ATPase